MKSLHLFLILVTLTGFNVNGQTITNYSYKLDNGITVKTENSWNQTKAQIKYDTAGYKENTMPLAVKISAVGSLISFSSYKVYASKGEVNEKELTPGTYTVKVSLNLSANPGKLVFDVENVVVKPKTKTILTINVYEYQVQIAETSGGQKGLSYYQSNINRYKGNNEQNLNWGLPSFYPPNKHDQKISPDEPMGDYYGRIKPGIYDVLISMEISGKTQKIWLNNFSMKPDISYNITTNLNAGQITYSGGNYEVKVLHLYPSGTANKQKGNPSPYTGLEIIGYQPANYVFAAPPGTYDILLNYGHGVKYEWRKGVSVRTGQLTSVK
jgi:hypothetical protein